MTSSHVDERNLEETSWLPLPAVPVTRRSAAAAVHVRTGGGRVVVVPAPLAVVGLASLLIAVLLAALEPANVSAAQLNRQASAIAAWEARENARVAASLAELEPEIRALRRTALAAGIVPASPVECGGPDSAHISAHLAEARDLTAAILAKVDGAEELDLLPSRSPIDLVSAWTISSSPATPGVHVSSGMGKRSDPFTGVRRSHNGLDLSAPTGTPVIAPSAGVVEFAGSVDANEDHARGLLGKHVLIRHGDTGYLTLYAHLSTVGVKAGQRVKGGDAIGAVGSTGRSTAPHLHYQVMRGKGAARENLDPLYFITDAVLVRDGSDVWYVPNREKPPTAQGAP